MNPQDTPQFDLRAPAQQAPVAQGAAPPPDAMDPKAQTIERLKGAVNVLVTVSQNPSVDQLAAAIGFTLVLNKLKKHGTAVFSGQTPSTIEFLQPEKTIEKDTDSLRDFIVALDKSKADKLRYKVEDKFVKIFITPYHTSLGQQDLEFGQGDFNVDVIIALGVGKKDELDQAITAHGRILHDATVVSITKQPGEDIGAINWHVPEASSFCEMLVEISDSLKSPQTELFDEQIATAFLTGIVAETDRFSNDKTTPQTMNMAAILMKAGANQQLIASKLEEPEPEPEPAPLPPAPAMPLQPLMPVGDNIPIPPVIPPEPPVSSDGSLQIPHIDLPKVDLPEPEPEPVDDIHIDDEGTLHKFDKEADDASLPSDLPPVSDELPNPGEVDHDDQTLEEIEKAVHSPHLSDEPTPAADKPSAVDELAVSAEEARKNVKDAEINAGVAGDQPLPPIDALNALPVDLDMGHGDQPGAPSDASQPALPTDTNPATPPADEPPATPPPLPSV